MSARRFVVSVTLLLSVAGVALGAERPVAVSPGNVSKLALIEDRCPTFSWGAVPGAKQFELVVYRIGKEGEEASPVLSKRISGSALSWTPDLDLCLERGGRYAWSVRARGKKVASEWSAASLFEVASGPSEAEFEEALAIVREYQEEQRASQEVSQAVMGSDGGSPALSSALTSPRGESTDEALALDAAANAPAAPLPSLSLNLDDDVQITTGNTPTLRLDQDSSSAFTPQTWDVRGNETVFFVRDATAATEPFAIETSAPTNSLRILADGTVEGRFAGPDPPCFNNTHRFVDCGNGTVTDVVADLIFLKNANCYLALDYSTASAAAADLFDGRPTGDCGLSDGSRRGDWRLPTQPEWQAIADSGCLTPPKILGNESGLSPGCHSVEPWADNVQLEFYWSSSAHQADTLFTYALDMRNGFTSLKPKNGALRVWPVRSVR